METNLKTKRNKKKWRGKKKRHPKDQDAKTIIRPDCFDGMSNWLNLKKTLKDTKERVPEKPKRSFPFQKRNKTQFKRRRLNNTKSAMSSDVNGKECKTPFKDKNDSGWMSGSETSPGPSNTGPKQKSQKSGSGLEFESGELNELTNVLAMDCEMVGTGYNGKDHMLARVSIVNSYGQCVYDTFVKPMDEVVDYRTAISGVRPSDLKNGKDLFEVQKEVSRIIEGRKIVGHALKCDFAVLYLSHPYALLRDTSKYKPFRDVCDGKTPSLKKLAQKLLGCDIQTGEHNSTEDAQAAMLLYLRHKKEWEKQIRLNRRKKPKEKQEVAMQ